MKKLLLVLTLLLVFGVWSAPALAAEVYYNGRLLCQSEHRYDSIDGASVPVRQLFEGLGYKVGWNAEYNNVYLEHHSAAVSFCSRAIEMRAYWAILNINCRLPLILWKMCCMCRLVC